VGQSNCASEAVQLAKQLLPDVILLDISLPGGGIDAGKEILRDCPEVRIIMLTVSDSEVNIARCLQLGARGYILKGAGQLELTSGVRAVYNGGMYLSPELRERLKKQLPAARPMSLAHGSKKLWGWSCKGSPTRRLEKISRCKWVRSDSMFRASCEN